MVLREAEDVHIRIFIVRQIIFMRKASRKGEGCVFCIFGSGESL